MRISDWSSDVCSSDLVPRDGVLPGGGARRLAHRRGAEPGDREGLARLGAGADQRAARLLDPGDRHRAAADRAAGAPRRRQDRKSAVEGKSVSDRVDLGGRRIIKKQKEAYKAACKTRARIVNH